MKNILLLQEVKHEQFIVTDYNEYGEQIETTLPENITVFTEIDERDLQLGMQNAYAVQM